MEATAEGLAKAAATREALKKKKRELELIEDGPPSKKQTGAAPSAVCTHEVACPKGFDPSSITLDPERYGTLEDPQWKGKPAKEYPFVLDSFQAKAVACVERKENVLVAAHTSAGKTAIAEYAIAKAFAMGQRVFYTSPIKALSNQKFRELSEEFGDVGLMTGDVSINPNAACIVMTTEILRSMIYRGSELLRETAWIVFDEVHYMQDRERGVIWEETIIFAPKDARMVFLSATLSNATEFADWVASVHQSPCHVVYTEFRPTPLRHFAFPSGGDGLYLVMNEFGEFRDDNFQKLQKVLGKGGDGGQEGKGKRGGGGGGGKPTGASAAQDLRKIVMLIKERKLDPVIVFSFSRRECESNAMLMAKADLGALDFNTQEEKETVDAVFQSALQCLSEKDRDLRAVAHIYPLLRCGIGIHHSGLLPIIKEVVEILFQEQLIKCLFATETFAMGLNMPARTVVFTAMRKWDGQEERWMGSGEYIQMSGRAGRRGKDDRGMTIMMMNNSMDEATCKAIIKGKANPLLSSFRLSYYTLLNLMRRVEGSGASMEYVIQHSFSQFQHEKELPALEARLEEVQAAVAAIGDAGEETAAEYTRLKTRLAELESTLAAEVRKPERCLHYLRPGRLVRVVQEGVDWGWGVVVSAMREERGNAPPAAAPAYHMDTLLCCAGVVGGEPTPALLDDERGSMEVIPVPLGLLHALSTLRISIPQDLRPPEARRAVLQTLKALRGRYPGGALPLLHPVADMGIEDTGVAAAAAEREEVAAALTANPISKAERGEGEASLMAPLREKARLMAEAESLAARMRASQLTSFRDEARHRGAVLRKLGYVDGEGVVTLKGRVACEINTADELLATELMLNGTFNALDRHQLVAMVSCLVQVEKSNEQIRLKESLARPLQALQDAARRIAEVSVECRLEVKVDEYVESFWPFLMDVIYAWSKGASFAEICEMTDLFEGSIVRATRRLDELMSELERAALAVGDAGLAAKIAESRDTIRRDIMFAASLYI
ncbi:hypothetical protein ACKKBG_A22275 [Auxenochlorella protothecoides x Auxenochlorella symbiontica]